MTEGLKSNIGLFADDAKLYSEVQNQTDANALQQDLDTICNWAHKWQLNFNLNKCKVLHIGKKNKKFQYYMTKEGIKQELYEEIQEKDLGVTFEVDGSFDTHINNCVKSKSKFRH